MPGLSIPTKSSNPFRNGVAQVRGLCGGSDLALIRFTGQLSFNGLAGFVFRRLRLRGPRDTTPPHRRGLANVHAATIVATRANRPFLSLDDCRRRVGVPTAVLVQLAEADAFRPAMGLARREALWVIKALRDKPHPSSRLPPRERKSPSRRLTNPPATLRPMTSDREVVVGTTAISD